MPLMSQPNFAFNNDQRTRQLIEAAEQSFARGRGDEGERLLRQAELEAPAHPLVMNETARRMLAAGNPGKAVEILQDALQREASHPGMWLNLAVALHERGERQARGRHHGLQAIATADRCRLAASPLKRLNDSPVHRLRIDYGDQRNHQSWILYIGGTGCDGHCPHHGAVCLREKRGFDDRKHRPILDGIQRMAPSHGMEHDHGSGL